MSITPIEEIAPEVTVNEEVAITLAEQVINTSFEDLPLTVVDATKNQVIDTLGIAIAGANAPGAQQLREFTCEMGGKPEARIWGMNVRVPAQNAARVNATMAHALDYDDTYERSFVHPAAFTIPTALAVAETIGSVSGTELITAIALGVDVSCRLANAARPGVTGFIHGWHNTTLYGYFGAAITAGKLLGLDRDQLVSALGVAYQQASGNSQAHIDGALTKRMGPGLAAYGGILSARLAQRNVHGAKGVFEGARGFFFQYHGNNYSRDILVEGLGTTFCGSDISFKPWPACRGSHTAIDAALKLRSKHDLNVADIAQISISNGPGDHALLASPLEKKRVPCSPVDAQFSNPWVVSAALVDGRVGLEHFTDEAITRTDLLGLTSKIVVDEDEALVRPGGGPGAARITIELVDGRTLSQTVALAKGEPGNPMTKAEFQTKFLDCTARAGLSAERSTQLLAALSNIERLTDVSRILDGTTTASA